MKAIAIIPARMGSSRFPGKPLAKIHGIPMVGHCYYRTQMCKELFNTYVATCDKVIYDYIKSIGGNAVMTSNVHERASDRTAEAMLKIEADIGEKVDIVVLVQGDEPMVTPEMIEQSLKPFKSDKEINVVNLMADMQTVLEFENPSEVKVVVNKYSEALYFSREGIPSRKKGFDSVPMLKQVCIIPFKRDYLLKFNNMHETDLERIESVDMMRVLENGEKVHMVKTEAKSFSVDTEEELIFVEKQMVNDPLISQYKTDNG
jgi:3-deoxy-manno-octulosonate cytidylyltransferase (CMP-KDO synthetase)